MGIFREPRAVIKQITVEKGLKARGLLELGGVAPSSNVLLLGAGSSTDRATTATANANHFEFRLENTATSGDNRGMYLRLYLGGAGGGGEAARIFTSVDDVAAGTAHGAHISLGFESTGSVTGLGVAMRSTLHIPDDATWAPGNIAALQAEIWSDGDDSDTDGATLVAFMLFVNGGNANGIADVDDDAYLFALSGGSIASGNVVEADTDETKFSHKVRVLIHGTPMWLMVADS